MNIAKRRISAAVLCALNFRLYGGSKMRLLNLLVGLMLFISSGSVLAYTECTTRVTSIYAGDNGNIWMMFENGQVAMMPQTAVDAKNIFALATTSLITNKLVRLRVAADSVPCNGAGGTRSDVVGFWIQRD